ERAARITQGHHEQPRLAIAAAPRIQRERALAVIDLSLFPGQKFQAVKLFRFALAQTTAESLDAVIAACKPEVIHQFLIDRRSVAAQPDLGFDPYPMRLARGTGMCGYSRIAP